MTAMTDLADRIEALEGLDREVDAAIHDSLAKPKHRKHPYLVGTFIDDSQSGAVYSCPAYTSSINAAMTLVPEGCGFSVHNPSRPDPDNRPSATVWGRLTGTHFGEGQTPALALCAAALRARKAQP